MIGKAVRPSEKVKLGGTTMSVCKNSKSTLSSMGIRKPFSANGIKEPRHLPILRDSGELGALVFRVAWKPTES